MKRLRVSGLDAVSFSRQRVWPYRGQWVTSLAFSRPSSRDPRREAKLRVYDRMLASMRIDPVILHQRGSGRHQIPAQVHALADHSPDIVALQEVTQPMMEVLATGLRAIGSPPLPRVIQHRPSREDYRAAPLRVV